MSVFYFDKHECFATSSFHMREGESSFLNGLIALSNRLPGDISAVEPPDPIPNSEVKRSCADGSVGLPCESRSLPGSFPLKPSSLVG